MTAVTVDTTRIVHGMPDAQYRGADGINQSTLKTILDCPARALHEMTQVRFFRRRESGGSDA